MTDDDIETTEDDYTPEPQPESGWWAKINPPIRVRQWAYGIAAAGLALAGAYGLIEGDQRAALELLAAALFGMARANTHEV